MAKSNLDAISKNVMATIGISATGLAKLKKLDAGRLRIRGSIDENFDLPITAGRGQVDTSKTTFGVTIKGTFEIISPPDGKWTLTINDGGTLISKFTNAVPGQRYKFEYKTRFTLDLHIEAVWSKKQDTTLRINLKAKY